MASAGRVIRTIECLERWIERAVFLVPFG
jgi:hypothetical protein